jgi:hypothetical protein
VATPPPPVLPTFSVTLTNLTNEALSNLILRATQLGGDIGAVVKTK